MSLPWVRLDSNVYAHDKILWLVAQRDGWRAYGVYTFALAYSGGQATDGFIPGHVLPVLQGTDRIAQLLVDAGLWKQAKGGWNIHNWDQRQELAIVTAAKKEGARLGGLKRSCVMHHGPECGCWEQKGAEILPLNRRSSG